MTITRHGIRFTASTSSPAPDSTRIAAPANAAMPTWTFSTRTLTISAAITASVIQWRGSSA